MTENTSTASVPASAPTASEPATAVPSGSVASAEAAAALDSRNRLVLTLLLIPNVYMWVAPSDEKFEEAQHKHDAPSDQRELAPSH